MSDELEKSHRNERRRKRQLWMVSVLGGLGAAAFVGGLVYSKTDGGWPTMIGGLVTVGGLAAIIISFARAGRYMPDGYTARIESAKGGYRDKVQKSWALKLALMPLTSLYLVYRGTLGAWSIASGQGDKLDWYMIGLSPVISVLLLVMVAGLDNPGDKKMKRLLEDELTLSFRRDALNVALGVAMIGLLVVFGLGLWRPEAAVAALPGLMFVTASAAGLRYWQLDRRASGG